MLKRGASSCGGMVIEIKIRIKSRFVKTTALPVDAH
jgi:hypothetical protein